MNSTSTPMSGASSSGATHVSVKADTTPEGDGADSSGWSEPDMGVLRLRRRPPPALPLEVFGETWKQWLLDAAVAAACPVDYVAAPLLASVSTLIGNARWAQAWPGWSEPPHLWAVVVGDSGTGKSPGADCLMRDVLPTIEQQSGRRLPRSSAGMAGRCRIRQDCQETLEG